MTREWFNQVTYSALAYPETSEATYDIARQIIERDVPGDFVECGVFAGAQIAMMAKAMLDHAETPEGSIVKKHIHLFDSFAGIPLAGPEDHELQGKPEGISACSMEEVKANMAAWGIPDDLLVYHKGLFEDTVPGANIPQIALLRLDGDLYRSTKVCMDYLHPKVVRGGWVIVDDFNLSGARQAVLETCVPAPVYWRIPAK